MTKRTDESYVGRLDGDGKTGFENSLGASTSENTIPKTYEAIIKLQKSTSWDMEGGQHYR